MNESTMIKMANPDVTQVKLENMPVLVFLNTFPDWKERLSEAPFSLSIRESGEYVLLKYTQFNSDMSYLSVRESRGSVFRQNESGEWIYVCRPFDKFFNFNEEYAAPIDWKCAKVTEKIDGSLMKLWFDKGSWHLSTNGKTDAFMAFAGDSDWSFGNIFERALGTDIQTLGSTLDKSFTYMFELTSAETRIVIGYDDGVYYLTRRNTESGEELFDRPVFTSKAQIRYPRRYDLNNLDDVITVAKDLSRDEEGFVVKDDNGNRIKVKSPEYLLAAKVQMNGQVTDKRIFEYIKKEKIDDFLAYAPQYRARVETIQNKIKNTAAYAESEWDWINKTEYADQMEFAATVKDHEFSAFFFIKRQNNRFSALDYLFSITTKKALKHLNLAENRNSLEKEKC